MATFLGWACVTHRVSGRLVSHQNGSLKSLFFRRLRWLIRSKGGRRDSSGCLAGWSPNGNLKPKWEPESLERWQEVLSHSHKQRLTHIWVPYLYYAMWMCCWFLWFSHFMHCCVAHSAIITHLRLPTVMICDKPMMSFYIVKYRTSTMVKYSIYISYGEVKVKSLKQKKYNHQTSRMRKR